MRRHLREESIQGLLIFFLRLVERAANAAQMHFAVRLPSPFLRQVDRRLVFMTKVAKERHRSPNVRVWYSVGRVMRWFGSRRTRPGRRPPFFRRGCAGCAAVPRW